MAIKFTGNVEFKGKQAFEVRAEYATLVAMKSADERGLNDGLIAFNKETNKHYTFLGSNTVDNTTGKWRELLVEASKIEAKIDEKLQEVNTEEYVLPAATDTVRGGVKLGFTQVERKFPVQQEEEKLYVEVPVTETALNQKIFTKTQSEFEQLERDSQLVADAIYFIKD